MMDPLVWLEKAASELAELGPLAEDDPGDAWRSAVLLARLLGSPAGPPAPPELVQRLPHILNVAGFPDPQQVLDDLADELGCETDPWGLLLDHLLDVDDMLGVLGISSQHQTAGELAARVAALVAICPERVLTLEPFAEMRLRTLREDATADVIWRAVLAAPALLLVAALPESTDAGMLAPSSTSLSEPLHPSVWAFRLPESLHLAAAASVTSQTWELATDDAGMQAWVYVEDGRMRLEVHGAGAVPRTTSLIAERAADSAEVARVLVETEVAGGTVYADLGPWAGPDNVLHQLAAHAGMSPNELRIRLTVSSE